MKYEIRFIDGTTDVVEADVVALDERGPDYVFRWGATNVYTAPRDKVMCIQVDRDATAGAE